MKSKPMTEKVSLRHALTYLGNGFTARWIEEKEDPKLNGFLVSAECCRKDSRLFYRLILFAIVMFVNAGGSAYALTDAFRSPTYPMWLAIGLMCSTFLSGFIGAILVFCMIPDVYPGKTKLRVARDWEKWRKSVLNTGVAMSLADSIRNEEQRLGDFASYSLPEMADVIAEIVSGKMVVTAEDVKKHEREGFERRRKKARALFSELQLLHAIGIKVKPTSYFFAR